MIFGLWRGSRFTAESIAPVIKSTHQEDERKKASLRLVELEALDENRLIENKT